MRFYLDGKKVISGSSDKTIKVWDIETYKEQITMNISRQESYVSSTAFSPDSKHLASISSGDVKVWDMETGAEMMTLYNHKETADRVKFSPDGNHIISANWDGTIRVWDATTGKDLMTLHGHNGFIPRFALSSDGKHIVSTRRDKTIKIWDATTGVEVMNLAGHKDGVAWSLTYSPDGSRIISGGMDGTIKVWDAETGAELMTFRYYDGPVNSIEFSPDGKFAVSCIGDIIKVLDAETFEEVMNLYGHLGVISIVFSPDGKRIFSVGSYNDVKVWNFATGTELMSFDAYSDTVIYPELFSIVVSSDGRTIAAGGMGGIFIWETKQPACGYESRKNGAMAGKLVDELYRKYDFYYDVIDKLQTDKTLDDPVRKIALQISNSRRWEDADQLMKESWSVVYAPRGNAIEYQEALRKAEKAVSLEPNEPFTLTTLGIAQYRVGAFEDALKTLTRVDKIWTDANEPHAIDVLAFIAMSLNKLGQTEAAKVALEQLHSLLKDERLTQDGLGKRLVAKATVAEAEKLIEGK